MPELIRSACASAVCRHAYVAVVSKGSASLRVASDGLPFYILELTSVSDSIAQELTETYHSPQLLDGPRDGIFHCGIMWMPDEWIPSNIAVSTEPVHCEVRDSINQLVQAGETNLLDSLRKCNALAY